MLRRELFKALLEEGHIPVVIPLTPAWGCL